jgi:hypothetical protein
VVSRQQLDGLKLAFQMGGVSENVTGEKAEADISKLSLAELEKIISDLKVVEAEPVKAEPDLDFLK